MRSYIKRLGALSASLLVATSIILYISLYKPFKMNNYLTQFTYNNTEFTLIKHDALLIRTKNVVIYLDPFHIPSDYYTIKADVIFITHDHFDHFSPDDILQIYKKGTICVFPSSITEKIEAGLGSIRDSLKFVPIEISKHYKLTDYSLAFSAIPAYNINKFRSAGVPYHPREAGYVGYLLSISNSLVYFAGDTDNIEEMKHLAGKVDIAFLPVSGKYVMTIDEAVEATKVIKPKVVVPMHYGEIVGDLDYGERFADKLKQQNINIPVYFYKSR